MCTHRSAARPLEAAETETELRLERAAEGAETPPVDSGGRAPVAAADRGKDSGGADAAAAAAAAAAAIAIAADEDDPERLLSLSLLPPEPTRSFSLSLSFSFPPIPITPTPGLLDARGCDSFNRKGNECKP